MYTSEFPGQLHAGPRLNTEPLDPKTLPLSILYTLNKPSS